VSQPPLSDIDAAAFWLADLIDEKQHLERHGFPVPDCLFDAMADAIEAMLSAGAPAPPTQMTFADPLEVKRRRRSFRLVEKEPA
jgi:hypothetical protein